MIFTVPRKICNSFTRNFAHGGSCTKVQVGKLPVRRSQELAKLGRGEGGGEALQSWKCFVVNRDDDDDDAMTVNGSG